VGPEPGELSTEGPVLAGLKRATVSATAWTAGSTVSQQLIQLAFSAVLGRLLLPREYGLVAMIVVFTGFASLFVDSGFGAALVQRKEITAAHLSTAFWANLGAGVAVSAVVAGISPLVARFYGQPQLKVLMAVAGIDFVVVALKITQLALLERRMLYRRLAVIDNVSLALAGAAAISCAVAGLGVWSLIVFTFVSDGVDSFLLWVLSDWRPSFSFDRGALRDLWSYGGNMLASTTLNYWFRNLDNLLIGRFVGAAALGLYSRAYNLALLQLRNVSFAAGRPLFPALSRLQDEPARFRHAYLRAISIIALVTFPIATGFLVAARPLVVTLFGARWAGVAPLVQILGVAAVVQSIGTSSGLIYQARGRTDSLLRWQMAWSGTAAIAFGIGIHWGAKGVAVAVSAQSVALMYPIIAVPGRMIGMRFRDVVGAVGGVVVAAVLCGAAAWAAGRGLRSHAPELQLLAQVAAGGVVYIGFVHVARIAPYRELREIVAMRRAAGRQTAALASKA